MAETCLYYLVWFPSCFVNFTQNDGDQITVYRLVSSYFVNFTNNDGDETTLHRLVSVILYEFYKNDGTSLY